MEQKCTRANLIRSMSDRELAKQNIRGIGMYNDEQCWTIWITSDGESYENYDTAFQHELEWLQQEAD